MRRELVRRPDELPRVRFHHVLEDGHERGGRARLVVPGRLHHLRLVRVDEPEERVLVLLREDARERSQPGLAREERDGQARGAHLERLHR
eukprot:29033-Pelagococcus_subviridis.AAC.1